MKVKKRKWCSPPHALTFFNTHVFLGGRGVSYPLATLFSFAETQRQIQNIQMRVQIRQAVRTTTIYLPPPPFFFFTLVLGAKRELLCFYPIGAWPAVEALEVQPDFFFGGGGGCQTLWSGHSIVSALSFHMVCALFSHHTLRTSIICIRIIMCWQNQPQRHDACFLATDVYIPNHAVKHAFQAMGVHSACWEVCIPGKPGNKPIGIGKDRTTDACFENCTRRFLDATQVIVSKQGGGMR